MRHRLIEGQQALPIFELPPVKYCRGRCGHRLRSLQSIERGYGATCWRHHQQKAKARKQRRRKEPQACAK